MLLSKHQVKRKSKSRAFASAFVFPGGIEEEIDKTFGLDVEKVCALRELYEETGIVLGLASPPPERLRKECSENASVFRNIYKESELKAASSRLMLWSVWLTPKQEKVRQGVILYRS